MKGDFIVGNCSQETAVAEFVVCVVGNSRAEQCQNSLHSTVHDKRFLVSHRMRVGDDDHDGVRTHNCIEINVNYCVCSV